MASRRSWFRSPGFGLFADACLLTAAVFVLSVAVGGGLVTLLGRIGGPVADVVAAILGPVTTFACLFAGPYAAWRLNGKRLTGPAVLGAFFGIAVTAIAVVAFVALMLTVARPIMGDEAPAAIALVGLFALGLVAVMISRIVAALRDLKAPREKVALDRALLGAALLVALFAAAMGGVVAYLPSSEIIEAVPFMLVFALIGGMMTVGADLVTRHGAPPETSETAASA